jgi:hypothetical protein
VAGGGRHRAVIGAGGLALLATLAMVGCKPAFECEDNSWCRRDGEQGRCDENYCSFPANDCPSGYAWAELAPPHLAGTCVPIEDASTGASDTGDAETNACPPEPACTLYVAHNGNDEGFGEVDAPVATVQRAVDLALPGDVICVAAGRYPDPVEVAKSGTPAEPIVLRAEEPGVALEGGLRITAGWGTRVGHIVVEGFAITGGIDQCVWMHSAHDVVLRHNEIHDCATSGIRGSVHALVLDGNRISRCGTAHSDPSSTSGASLTGSAVLVHNNVFVGNGGYGLALTGNPWDPDDPNHPADERFSGARDWVVSNNVFAFNVTRCGVLAYLPDATGASILNNIFIENAEPGEGASGPNGIDFYGSGGGHVVQTNLYFGSSMPVGDTNEGASHVESGALLTDPRFVAAASGDFRLLDSSPAIDAGTLALAPDHDIACRPRPRGDGVDLGVHEVQ